MFKLMIIDVMGKIAQSQRLLILGLDIISAKLGLQGSSVARLVVEPGYQDPGREARDP